MSSTRMKVGVGIGAVLAVAVAAGAAFKEPLQAAVVDRITADMFVAQDADSFNPGVAAGQRFPALKARLTDGVSGRQVASIGEFMGTRGVVVFVNRSVDW